METKVIKTSDIMPGDLISYNGDNGLSKVISIEPTGHGAMRIVIDHVSFMECYSGPAVRTRIFMDNNTKAVVFCK